MYDTITEVEADVVAEAKRIAPLVAARAQESDRRGRLDPEVVAALTEAGLTRMRMPRRYGGGETDARTLMEAVATIAAADGSAGWNTAVWSISAWLASQFPDEVQDEVFADPGVKVCGVLSPSAVAEPTAGGVRISGRWHFVSGALHSAWQVVLAMGPAPDGSQWPLMAMVPMSDLGVVDDWDASGLRGTGSVSTVAEGVFVPEIRVLPLPLVLQGQIASVANAESIAYRVPMIAAGCAGFIGVAIGLARGAQDEFRRRTPTRKITYTAYENQAEAPVTHFQAAEAALLLEETEFHGGVVADHLDGHGVDAPWSLEERTRTRAGLGRAFALAKQSVDIVRTGSGGTSLYRSEPIQRIQRDVDALNQHALMHPNTNYELFGRILCGQAPNTMYL